MQSNEALQAIVGILDKLTDEDRTNLIGNLVRGMFKPYQGEISAVVGAIFELQGVLVVTIGESGIVLDSTAHENADDRTLNAVKSLHDSTSQAIDAYLLQLVKPC